MKFRMFTTLVYTSSLDYSGMHLLRKSSVLWKHCWLKYDWKKSITDFSSKLFKLWGWEIPCGNILTAATLQRVTLNNLLLESQQMNGIDNALYKPVLHHLIIWPSCHCSGNPGIERNRIRKKTRFARFVQTLTKASCPKTAICASFGRFCVFRVDTKQRLKQGRLGQHYRRVLCNAC